MTVLLFLLILVALVVVHEFGHFAVAKLTGMKVEEFGVGFPPRIYGKQYGETLYSVNLLPIGGFVKITGEDGLQSEIGEDANRVFSAKSKWAQAAVLLAGVTMNVLFAWLLFVGVYLVGLPTSVDESVAGPTATLEVTNVLPDSPAEAAGIPLGATVLSLNSGSNTLNNPTPSSFADFIEENSGSEILVEYRHKGVVNSVALTPTTGVLPSDQNQPGIGIAMSMVELNHLNLFDAVIEASKTTVVVLKAIVFGVGALLAGIFSMSADLSQVAGPVGMVGMVGDAASFGLTSLLVFTAFISLNLAVINLLPVPALDGGRLLFVGLEALLGRAINPVWMSRVNYFGFALLLGLMVLVTFSDVTRLF